MFDEQPDAPLHGECAAEIHRLQEEVARLELANAALQQQVNAFYLGSPIGALRAGIAALNVSKPNEAVP